jgi:hypothetical protein
VESITLEAANVRELITLLEERFPGLAAKGLADMTVAVDGELMSNAELEPLRPRCEVHFLQPTGGG